MAKITIKTDEILEIDLSPAISGHKKITVRKPNYSEIKVALGKNDGSPAGTAAANDFLYQTVTNLSPLDLEIMPGAVIKAIDDFLAT